MLKSLSSNKRVRWKAIPLDQSHLSHLNHCISHPDRHLCVQTPPTSSPDWFNLQNSNSCCNLRKKKFSKEIQSLSMFSIKLYFFPRFRTFYSFHYILSWLHGKNLNTCHNMHVRCPWMMTTRKASLTVTEQRRNVFKCQTHRQMPLAGSATKHLAATLVIRHARQLILHDPIQLPFQSSSLTFIHN